MRTKTLALTAMLSMLGGASVMAQNVYSINAVGYVQVTVPAGQIEILTDPLTNSVNNTVGTILNNSSGALTGSTVWFFLPGEPSNIAGYPYSSDTALAYAAGGGKGKTTNPNGWGNAGTNIANPGTAFWFAAPASSAMTLTFVGSVPTGTLVTDLAPGFNLTASTVPLYGDLMTTASMGLNTVYGSGDSAEMFDPTVNNYPSPPSGIGGVYDTYPSTGKHSGAGYNNNWGSGGTPIDPTTYAPTQGFWWNNNQSTTEVWTQTFSIN